MGAVVPSVLAGLEITAGKPLMKSLIKPTLSCAKWLCVYGVFSPAAPLLDSSYVRIPRSSMSCLVV